MAFRTIEIHSYEDYKAKFGDKYCNSNRSIRQKYLLDIFEFRFSYMSLSEDSRIIDGYKGIVSKYKQLEFRTVFEFEIKENADYEQFFKIAHIREDGAITISAEFPNCSFEFKLFLACGKFDELLLHNYILLFLKAPTLSFKMRIISDSSASSDTEYDFFRISSYLSGCSKTLRDSIRFNGKPVSYSATHFGKIIPAIPINQKMYDFLKNPLERNAREYVFSAYDASAQFDGDEAFLQLLNACKRYLFWKRFEDHQSIKYQRMREIAFMSDAFQEQIQRMPFLALLLFAQYDYYYRSSVVKEFKSRINNVTINKADVVIEEQQSQMFERFMVHEKMCREGMNMKSILYFSSLNLGEIDNALKKTGIKLPGKQY